MSADILYFPMKPAVGIDQQRWIPEPRVRRASGNIVLGWLCVAGIAVAAVSSWGLIIGAVHLIATVL